MAKRKCKGCERDISHKHPNAKFHSAKCKDKFWNRADPRGYQAHDNDDHIDEYDGSWDAHNY